MRLGFTWRIIPETLATLEKDFTRMKGLGFNICNCGIRLPETYFNEDGVKFMDIIKRTGMELGALWCGFGNPCIFDLVDGPKTVGLVPETYREKRLKILADCATYAEKYGIRRIVTHVGFTPERQDDPAYEGVVKTFRRAGDISADHGCKFLMETGQETPTTLLRVLEDVNKDNVGVDLDTGNLVQYGSGEPCGAIDVLGKKYIWGVDAKDAKYPTGGRILGEERTFGEGVVKFDEVIKKLFDIGYTGDIMIEREQFGEEKVQSILKAKEQLEKIIAAEKAKRGIA